MYIHKAAINMHLFIYLFIYMIKYMHSFKVGSSSFAPSKVFLTVFAPFWMPS